VFSSSENFEVVLVLAIFVKNEEQGDLNFFKEMRREKFGLR